MTMVQLHRPLPCEPLSLREAVTLADVPEDRVKKDVERGWFEPMRVSQGGTVRLYVGWHDVFSLAAAYNSNVLNSKARSKLISAWHRNYSNACGQFMASILHFDCHGPLEKQRDENLLMICCGNHDVKPVGMFVIDKYIMIDMKGVFEDVAPRVENYARGLSRIERKPDVLGGEAVFVGSRLPVIHVGGMLQAGETIENIIEDYPYLSESDVHFARMYFLAHPPVGRPPSSIGTSNAASSRRDDVSKSRKSTLGIRY